MRITTAWLDSFQSPKKRPKTRQDVTVTNRRGLVVRVHPSGAVSFRFRYKRAGQSFWMVLGEYGPQGLSLADAHEMHERALREIEKGLDPCRAVRPPPSSGRTLGHGGRAMGPRSAQQDQAAQAPCRGGKPARLSAPSSGAAEAEERSLDAALQVRIREVAGHHEAPAHHAPRRDCRSRLACRGQSRLCAAEAALRIWRRKGLNPRFTHGWRRGARRRGKLAPPETHA
jgi:hypothetical protein